VIENFLARIAAVVNGKPTSARNATPHRPMGWEANK